MKISIIVPMYNENSIIAGTVKTLNDYMNENFSDYEIIFVSDGSVDGCDKTVNDFNLPNIKVIAYKPNHGKGYAVKQGMLASTGDIAMFIDADLAYGTDVIMQAVQQFEKNPNKQVIVGSRTKHPEGYEGYTLLRKIASKVYIKVLNIYGGFKLSDSQCGCKAYKGAAIKDIFSKCETNGFAFDFETILLAQKLNYGIIEMPVKIINHRESKVNIFKDTIKMLKELSVIKKRIR